MQPRRAAWRILLLSIALSVVRCVAAEPVPVPAVDLPSLIAKAEHDDPDSQLQLVQLYLAGVEGTLPADPQRAVYWMERSAKLGVPEGQFMLGVAYLRGMVKNGTPQYGLDLLEKAAAANNTKALRVLASIYSGNSGSKGLRLQPDLALQYLTKAAECGDAEAQNDLGEVYRRGEWGAEINYSTALQWFRKSDATGYHEGIKNVGKCYQLGQGVAVDLDKALICYRRAGAKGNLHAIYNSGIIYRKRNQYSDAIRCLQEASDKGHFNAMDFLGDMYRDGLGVPRNPKKAFELYQKASDHGVESASVSLARAYENGWGTAKNPAEAFRCMTKVAAIGDDFAQKQLGDYYRDGVGVPRDGKAALRLYQQSASQGYAPGGGPHCDR